MNSIATGGDAGRKKQLLPWLVAVALFMESLDTTILNTGVPTIAEAMGVAPLSMKGALTSYTISLAVFIPVSGWIADRFGSRRVFFSAIAIFTLGSILCGVSASVPMLVASRVLQGCGGALMLPVGRIALVRTFPKSELLRAMVFVAMPGLLGPLLGPIVGGFIVAYLHWRVIFFVNVPMGLLGIGLAYRFMPDYRVPDSPRLDVAGLAYFGVGIGLLSYVLEVFGEHTLSLRTELLLLGVAAMALIGYGVHAARVAHPLLRLSLFRTRTFRTSVVGGFITRLGAGGMPFMLPLLYQVGLGYSPVQSGLLIMPQPIAAIAMRPLMPRILARIGYRGVLLANTLCMGGLIALFTKVGAQTPGWVIVVQAAAFGFLSSMQYTSLNTLAFADLGDAEASHGSSIASTAQQMSMSFGVAAASLLTAAFIGSNRQHDAALIRGIHETFLVLGGVTMASSLVFVGLKSDDGSVMSHHGHQDAGEA
jgi:EmrB/QacA subfamily drug resistance transporter